jgi:hypothetical protein
MPPIWGDIYNTSRGHGIKKISSPYRGTKKKYSPIGERFKY